ncbi:MAG: hypothetical protein U0941_29720 [Planctomycetaceae bacterium]
MLRRMTGEKFAYGARLTLATSNFTFARYLELRHQRYGQPMIELRGAASLKENRTLAGLLI